MFRDSLTAMYESVALTSGTTYSNTYDLGLPNQPGGANVGSANGDPRDPSIGEDLIGVTFTVGVAAFSGGTYEFDLIQAATATLSSSPTVLVSVTPAASTLVAGYKFFVAFPIGSITQRYIGARAILASTTPTVTITGWITAASLFDKKRDYTAGFQVL